MLCYLLLASDEKPSAVAASEAECYAAQELVLQNSFAASKSSVRDSFDNLPSRGSFGGRGRAHLYVSADQEDEEMQEKAPAPQDSAQKAQAAASASSSSKGSFFCGDHPVAPSSKGSIKENQENEEEAEKSKKRKVTMSLDSDITYIGDTPFPKNRVQRNESIQRSLSVFAIDVEPQVDETFLESLNFPLIENLPHESFWTHAPSRWEGNRLFIIARTLRMMSGIATVLFLSPTIFAEASTTEKILTVIGLTGGAFFFELRSDSQPEDKIETLSRLMDVLWKQVAWSEEYLIPYVKAFEAKVLESEEQDNPHILEHFLDEAMQKPIFAHKESVRGLLMYMKALRMYLEICYESLKELEQFEKEENVFWSNIQRIFGAWAKVGYVIACLFITSGIIQDNILSNMGQVVGYMADFIENTAGKADAVVNEGNTRVVRYSAKQAEFKTNVDTYAETTHRIGLQKCVHKGMAGELKKLEEMKKAQKVEEGYCSKFCSALCYPFQLLKSFCTKEENASDEEKRTSNDWYSSRDRRPSMIFTEQYFKEKPTNTITLFLEIMINRHHEKQRGRDVLAGLRHLGFDNVAFSSPSPFSKTSVSASPMKQQLSASS